MTTLGYALLGMLARAPLSGYDLTQMFNTQVIHFWSAKHSQIYPELARLEADELVFHELIIQRDKPDKKVFRITEKGLTALRDWVLSPTPTFAMRDEFTLKTYSLWQLEPAQVRAMFAEHEQIHAAQLESYEETKAQMQKEWKAALKNVGSPEFACYLTLERGIGYEREYRDWCRWVLTQFEEKHG